MAYSRPQTLVIVMSALGHKRTLRSAIAMSALPPKRKFGAASGMSVKGQ
jgi:hypothetical protein